jgi:Protein of unknown function (DUF3800)
MLYLDDSGKTDPKHPSKYLVYAGLSFNDADWRTLSNRITGAKAGFFPKRAKGRPDDWELKSVDFLVRNAWQRKNNREFCYELVSTLKRSGCSVYGCIAEKARARRRLAETWLVPLMFQRAMAKLYDEMQQTDNATAMIVCDWSSYKLDHHISDCVGSYAVSRGLDGVFSGVSYASSASTPLVQTADLIAGAFRISYEGGTHLDPLIAKLSALRYTRVGVKCVGGHPMDSVFKVF